MPELNKWGLVCLLAAVLVGCGKDPGTQTNAPLVEPAMAEGNYLGCEQPNAPMVSIQHTEKGQRILVLDRCGDKMILDNISRHGTTWLGEQHKGCEYHVEARDQRLVLSRRDYWDNTAHDFVLTTVDDYTAAITLRDRHHAAHELNEPLRVESEGAVGRFFETIFHYPIGRVEHSGPHRPH